MFTFLVERFCITCLNPKVQLFQNLFLAFVRFQLFFVEKFIFCNAFVGLPRPHSFPRDLSEGNSVTSFLRPIINSFFVTGPIWWSLQALLTQFPTIIGGLFTFFCVFNGKACIDTTGIRRIQHIKVANKSLPERQFK